MSKADKREVVLRLLRKGFKFEADVFVMEMNISEKEYLELQTLCWLEELGLA